MWRLLRLDLVKPTPKYRVPIAPLLFLGGFSALVYQTTWLREARLIFGTTTAAAAAVLAIFMGGLGLGGAIIGTRAQRHRNPLRLYARLELGITAGAALSPLLFWLVRHAYIALGGTIHLGIGMGTVVRLLMSALAIGLPAFLMGGTLPAAACAAVPGNDKSRQTVAVLYGVNTFGAVVGALVSTFYLLESWGNRATILLAVTLNGMVALTAWRLADKSSPSPEPGTATKQDALAPTSFIYVAAGITGFLFLLMEIVWYRMLAPLLSGSAFTFGLILAVALFGLGLGGIFAALFGARWRPTLSGFSVVSALQAVLLAIPFALGDRIALTTMLLRPLGSFGFYGHAVAWTIICAIVVLPAAIVSGIQFPWLISLLGQGRQQLGLQTGYAYAWNAVGAILGSLTGGFGLLPLLSAPGVWRAAVGAMGALAAAGGVLTIVRNRRGAWAIASSIVFTGLALCLIRSNGPTSFWRHSQIGNGRLGKYHQTKNQYRDLMNSARREIFWEKDGIESSVAMSNSDGLSFMVNGRSDGHTRGDAGTQIMLGLIPAAIHSKPERALVVGLGTGTTAGWLAAIPGIRQVDVVEVEPAIRKVAETCAPVNRNVLDNPKVNLIFEDGREFILTSGQKYDLIASEPSNPYRAGIATLFTREYYRSVASALNPGGVFAQWVQAYEIDLPTLQTVYGTLGSVFEHVDTWQTKQGDLLLVATMQKNTVDMAELRNRLNEEPFRQAIQHAWNTTRTEGFLAHFVGNDVLARAMAADERIPLNTDDRTVLEFKFARNIDQNQIVIDELRRGARLNGADRLGISNGEVDWQLVDSLRAAMQVQYGTPALDPDWTNDETNRIRAYNSYLYGNLEEALGYWQQTSQQILDLLDLQMVAECLADAKSDKAPAYITELRKVSSTEADAIEAYYLFQQGDFEQATLMLERTFRGLQSDPWPSEEIIARTLTVAKRTAQSSRSESLTARIYQELKKPFSAFNDEEQRRLALLDLARILDQGQPGRHCLEVIHLLEPSVPWQAGLLQLRKECYREANDPLVAAAEEDWTEFAAHEPKSASDLRFMSQAAPAPGDVTGFATEKSKP